VLLSAHEIAQSRERALNNMLELAAAWIEAGHGLSTAVAAAGRASIEHGGRHWSLFGSARPDGVAQLPAALWLDNIARAGRLFDEALSILGDTQKALIRSAEIQVHILDSLAIAAIDRASKTSPWEAELALAAMKSSLQSAELTLHEMSEVAIGTVELAENESHQAVGALSVAGPATGRRKAGGQAAA
jgi:hypothetical protein